MQGPRPAPPERPHKKLPGAPALGRFHGGTHSTSGAPLRRLDEVSSERPRFKAAENRPGPEGLGLSGDPETG